MQPLATLRTRSRYRSAAKAVLFEVSNVATSFRVASVALCDISTVSRVVLCDRCSTFALFSKDDSNFRGKSSIFETSIVILRGRCGTADVLRSVFFANRIVRAASSSDNVQIPWQAWHFVPLEPQF